MGLEGLECLRDSLDGIVYLLVSRRLEIEEKTVKE